MSWWHPDNFEKKRHNLELRSKIISALRQFFDADGFIEVETPALQICPVMDAHIHAFQTDLLDVDLSKRAGLYLHTSPEFDMKKLLVAGMTNIYQICNVYRNAEETRLHSPEFKILEWYRAGVNYTAIMDDCTALLRAVANAAGIQTFHHQDLSCDAYTSPVRLSVAQAFELYAQIDLNSCLDNLDAFKRAADNADIRITDADRWDDVFHAIMAAKIEPNLGIGAATILYDYPVCMAALSRVRADDKRYAERFELYVCGVELANAFSELCDADEQRARFNTEMAAKKSLYGRSYPADEEFFRALEYGMPQSAGIALGVDRLIMLACGADHIEQVLWAPVQTGKK